jgi:hypothetical protein
MPAQINHVMGGCDVMMNVCSDVQAAIHLP